MTEVATETLPSEGADPTAADDAGGQVEATDQTPSEPAPNYLDLNEVGDRVVKVKVDGEEIEVPVSELTSGYMRQADYTRKTQEVAFWRQVDQAMRNPSTAPAALQYLAQTFGVEVAQQVAAQHEDPEGEEYADPIERRLAEIEAEARRANEYVQQQQATAYLNQVVKGLAQKYEDFDAKAVVEEAVNRGITNPDQLEDVYKLMQFDRFRAMNAAQQEAADRAAAEAAARQQAAQQAAAVVASGGSAAAPVVPAPPGSQTRPMSIAEAWAAAKAELEAA